MQSLDQLGVDKYRAGISWGWIYTETGSILLEGAENAMLFRQRMLDLGRQASTDRDGTRWGRIIDTGMVSV